MVPHASAGVPSLALGDLEPYPFSTPSQSPLESAVRALAHGAYYLLTPPSAIDNVDLLSPVCNPVGALPLLVLLASRLCSRPTLVQVLGK